MITVPDDLCDKMSINYVDKYRKNTAMSISHLSSILSLTMLLYQHTGLVTCTRDNSAVADTSASVTLLTPASTSTSALSDYCLNESFNASCDSGHVILVTSARFGRMRPGRCISGDFNVGCVKDVKRLLDSACALRTSCDVSVRSFVDLHPCQRDFVSYLEASYDCIRVFGLSPEDQCTIEISEVQVTGTPGGYLARPRWYPSSIHSPRHAIGTSGCPWSLAVELGQKINISIFILPAPINAAHLESFTELLLIDEFSQVGIQNNDRSPCSSTSSSTIDVVVDDIVAKRRTHIRDVMCSKPERHLFTSSGNTIRVHVTGDVSDSGGRTLLMHFTAVGCPELLAPSGASVKKISESGGTNTVTLVGDNVMIRCNDSMETWYLTCQSNRWLGEMGNCSMKSVQQLKITENSSNSSQYHFDGVIVAILIGIVLGIVIGMILLVVLHFVRRRRHMRQAANTSGMALLTTRSQKTPSSVVNHHSVLNRPVDNGSGYSVDAGGHLMDVQTRLHVLPCDCDHHDFDLDLDPQFTYNTLYSSPCRRQVQLDYCNGLHIVRQPYNNTFQPAYQAMAAATVATAAETQSAHQVAAPGHQQSVDIATNS